MSLRCSCSDNPVEASAATARSPVAATAMAAPGETPAARSLAWAFWRRRSLGFGSFVDRESAIQVRSAAVQCLDAPIAKVIPTDSRIAPAITAASSGSPRHREGACAMASFRAFDGTLLPLPRRFDPVFGCRAAWACGDCPVLAKAASATEAASATASAGSPRALIQSFRASSQPWPELPCSHNPAAPASPIAPTSARAAARTPSSLSL